jgi:hypothetical protein
MKIEFEGFYDKKSFRNKEAFTERPSQKYLICRLVLALFLAIIFVPLAVNIFQSKEYFSRISYLAVLIPAAIYYLTIHPYVAPYFKKVPRGKDLNPILHNNTFAKTDVKK